MLALLAQTKTGTSNLASTLVTFDNNTVAGNSIIVISGNSSTTPDDVSGVTDSQGNQYTKILSKANSSVGEVEIWYTSGIIGGANTVTVAYTTGVACAVIIREYSGLIYANSLDKSASNTGNSTSLSSGNTTALVQNSELLIGAGLIPLADTFSAGGSFVNLVAVGAPLVVAVAAEDLLVTTGGVQSATFTSNLTAQWVCAIASFFLLPTGTTTSTSSTSSTSSSTSSTSSSTSSTSTSFSSTSVSTSSTSSSVSTSSTSSSVSSTSSSVSSTSVSSTSASTSISSTSTSISSTSTSSTSTSSTSSSTSISSTSSSFSSTSSSVSSTSRSTSSTSFSSTSSSSSTSTTTVPAPLEYSYQDSTDTASSQTFDATGTWTCPAGVTSVTVECWGGGGSGNFQSSAAGGGGGGYSRKAVAVTPSTSYTVTVGAGGAAVSNDPGNPGTDSWFSSAATVIAKGGAGGSGSTGGAGGSAASGVGDVTYSGGKGGNGTGTFSGGGGGGAGSTATGAAGNNATGSANGAATAITLIDGGIGTAGVTSGNPAVGGLFGGGSGGSFGTTGAAGRQGRVKLTWTTTGLVTSGADLINAFTNPQYGNISTDDGGYFIEYGSEYMISEFERHDTNNTDNIAFTYKGRSTQSTLTSPILIQIFNQNSSTWETLATVNTIPADTDFQITVTQTTNLSNYYASDNGVMFRSYQRII